MASLESLGWHINFVALLASLRSHGNFSPAFSVVGIASAAGKTTEGMHVLGDACVG
jgi:hypothetical protein